MQPNPKYQLTIPTVPYIETFQLQLVYPSFQAETVFLFVRPHQEGIDMFTGKMKYQPFMPALVFSALLLICNGVLAFGPSSDEKQAFKELMAVTWLTCNFEPVLTDAGEVLDGIGFDPRENRNRIITLPLEKSEIVKDVILDEDSPFARPMTLVFDIAKSKVQLAYPSRFFGKDQGSFTSLINVQEVGWLTPGALQLTHIIEVENDLIILNLVIYPGNKIEENFRALANFTYFGVMIVMAAQCSDNIDEDILPELKEINLRLESAGASDEPAES
jgi:hypothetical protein